MNDWLAQMYGNNGSPSHAPSIPDGQVKQAQLELFAKVAAENGVDLTALSGEQLEQYFTAFAKEAEAGGLPPFMKKDDEKKPEAKADDKKSDDKEKEEKEAALRAAAQREFEQKQASQGQLKEAELMGQTMAHAFVAELREINAAHEKTAAAAAQPATIGGASAFDSLAAHTAVKMAAAAGLNAEEAERKVAAVLTLGAKESTKIAAASNLPEATEVRALELLEQAGYPVTWG